MARHVLALALPLPLPVPTDAAPPHSSTSLRLASTSAPRRKLLFDLGQVEAVRTNGSYRCGGSAPRRIRRICWTSRTPPRSSASSTQRCGRTGRPGGCRAGSRCAVWRTSRGRGAASAAAGREGLRTAANRRGDQFCRCHYARRRPCESGSAGGNGFRGSIGGTVVGVLAPAPVRRRSCRIHASSPAGSGAAKCCAGISAPWRSLWMSRRVVRGYTTRTHSRYIAT